MAIETYYCNSRLERGSYGEVGQGKKYTPTGRYQIRNGRMFIELRRNKLLFSYTFWASEGDIYFTEVENFECGR